MTRVCVVGGGTTGLQAAAEASGLGSEVTVVEKDETPGLPWGSMPDLIRPLRNVQGPLLKPAPRASVRVLTAEASSCGAGIVTTSRGDVPCDSLILATGSMFEAAPFRGSRKPGVYCLNSQRSYQDLGRGYGSLDRIVVAGEGRRSLEVAERLAGDGRRVLVVVSHWQGGPPAHHVFGAISDAAKEWNVSITQGTLAAAVGIAGVEAVVIEGEVYPCDSLVFVPRRLPRVPATEAPLGRTGAVLVRRNLAAAVLRTFAAGGCAEVEGVEPPSTLAAEPSSSGRIAGANSLGEGLSLGQTWSTELLLFGLRWVRMKARLNGARRGGGRTLGRKGEGAACEIAFDPQNGRVTGMEFVNPISARVICEIPSALDLNLRALAYGGCGSSDISLISETARLGLEWQRY